MADLPESRGILVWLLLVDMINTIIQESIQVANCNAQASAVAAVVCYAILHLVFLLIAFVNFFYLCYDQHHWLSHVSLAIQAIGAFLYFLGDHLSVLLSRHGNELCCDSECLANSKIAGVVLQGVALVIFLVVPLECHILIENEESKSWYTSMDMITMILKIDTLYSVVITMVESPEGCSNATIAVSSVFLILCVIMGWIYGSIYGSIYIYRLVPKEINNMTKIENVELVTIIIIFVLVSLSLPTYILMDNNLPLDCACRCYKDVANMTVNCLNCTQTVNMTQTTLNCNQGVSIARLVCTIVIFVIIVSSSAILFSIYEAAKARQRNNKVQSMNPTQTAVGKHSLD